MPRLGDQRHLPHHVPDRGRHLLHAGLWSDCFGGVSGDERPPGRGGRTDHDRPGANDRAGRNRVWARGHRRLHSGCGRERDGMNLTELRAFADARTTRSAFRLETLDRYDVDSDQDNFRRYLAGEDGPSWAAGDEWMDYLAAERASGIRRYRVHLFASPLRPYLRS